MIFSGSNHSWVRMRLLQGSRARTSHRPYSAPLNHPEKLVHSRGDGLSSPCLGCCLVRQDMRSLQQSHALPVTTSNLTARALREYTTWKTRLSRLGGREMM